MRFQKHRKVVPTCSGDLYHVLYRATVKANGDIVLVEDGKEDIKQKINSFRDVTDMSYILKQMALGNTSVLNASPGMYGDFTKMPKTMAEAMQIMIDAEKAFYELPIDVRNNFDNDVQKWIAIAGTEDWVNKMNFALKDEESEVKLNVQES